VSERENSFSKGKRGKEKMRKMKKRIRPAQLVVNDEER